MPQGWRDSGRHYHHRPPPIPSPPSGGVPPPPPPPPGMHPPPPGYGFPVGPASRWSHGGPYGRDYWEMVGQAAPLGCYHSDFGRWGFPSGPGAFGPSHRWDEDSSDSDSEDETNIDYEITIDLKQFKRKNVNVRLAGKYLIVEATGKERRGPGQHQRDTGCWRYFTERRIVPRAADRSKLTATLDHEGLLTVRAPPRENQEGESVLLCDRQIAVQSLS